MPIYKMDGKKDGKQKYRVRINYIDSSGKPKQIDRVAYGSDEAKTLERCLIEEIKKTPPTTAITIKKLYDEYTAYKKLEVRASSLDKTKRILERYVLAYYNNFKLNKLTPQELRKWKNKISEFGLSITTSQNIYGEFRALLNYAVKCEYLIKNPLQNVGNFKDAYSVPEHDKIQYYTADQFKKYINYAKSCIKTLSDYDYYVFFSIAYYTGMRKGEINALKWSDIENDILHVRRSINQKLKGNEDVETPPKNKTSYRSLQMPFPLIKILDEHKERQKVIESFSDDFRICGGIRCLRDSSLDKKNQAFAKGAGLPHIRIHDFRHSHASLLANEGINIQEIARRLGHSKIEITWNTYAHLYPREEERAVKILNGIIT